MPWLGSVVRAAARCLQPAVNPALFQTRGVVGPLDDATVPLLCIHLLVRFRNGDTAATFLT
jgi:hypothetical protein